MKNIFFLFIYFISSFSFLLAQEPNSVLRSPHKSTITYLEKTLTDNQLNYDVSHYGLNLTFLPDNDVIDGFVNMTATVIEEAIDHVELDLSDALNVSSVIMDENELTFTHNDYLLNISFGQTLAIGTTFTIQINYSGTPDNNEHFDFDEYEGEPMIWSLSEPYGAREWWPCKDYPYDKADSADMIFTVPTGMIAASNGTLESTTVNGDFTTYSWHESYPITTYLVSIAAYPYATFSHSFDYGGDEPMPVDYYVFPNHLEQLQDDYALIVPMLETFSSLFGQYPFINEKYGHAEFLGDGGMEHQTLSSLDSSEEDLLSHELAHQWWGNHITNESFHHIWLNEGFATYSEALWVEATYGQGQYADYMDDTEYLGAGTIFVENPEEDNIFDAALSYSKGSWVVHMLRHVLGDDTFFEILPQWAATVQEDGTGTTEDFMHFCEQVSGMDLGYFFEQWIYGERYPAYNMTWSNTGTTLNLTIEQTQNWQLFKMPIDITVTTASGQQTFIVWDSLQTQNFQLDLTETPLVVQLDKDNWILKTVNGSDGTILGNHTGGNLRLTVSAIGSIGFDEPDGDGDGFIYPFNGSNLLWHGGLMIGNSAEYVADSPSDEGSNDWAVSLNPPGFLNLSGSEVADQDGWAMYTDANHPNPKNIRVTQRSFSWSASPNDEFVIMEYTLTNHGAAAVNNLYTSIFMDYDLDSNDDDTFASDMDRKFIYMMGFPYAGIRILGDAPMANLTGISIDDYIEDNDGFTEEEKYPFLSGELSVPNSNEEQDWSILASSGPYDIAINESITVAFAIIGGEQIDEIIDNADAAQNQYELITGLEDLLAQPSQNLLAIHPNPVKSSTQVLFSVPQTDLVTIDILDIQGRVLQTIVNKQKINGQHQIEWQTDGFPKATYFCRLTIGEYQEVVKVIVLE